jgi:hypothetical protein
VSETIDQFHTRLHSISKNCEFSDVDFEIMVQIVIGGKSSRVRKQALRDQKIFLKRFIARREARRNKQNTSSGYRREFSVNKRTARKNDN